MIPTFSIITEPAAFPAEDGVYAVVMPTGTFVKWLSIKVIDPTSGLLVPPALMEIPVPQLLMLMPS